MITCPQCGAENLPGMAYCEHCGAPLAAPEAAAPTPAVDTSTADAIAQAQAVIDQLDAGDGKQVPAVAQPGDQPTADPSAGAQADAGVDAAVAAPDSAQGVASAQVDPGSGADPGDAVLTADQTPASSAAVDTPVAASPAVSPSAPSLTFNFGEGGLYSVQGDVTNVGRSDVAQAWHPELDVIPFGGGAPDFGVSRHQAVIHRTGGTFSIVDVGSTNGTFVNGRVLEYNKPAELHDGDAVAFGAFNAKVSIK
jgi:hypothetical protein